MNVQKFHFPEMFNNSKGKTSLGLVLCFVFGVVAAVGFLACAVVVVYDSISATTVNTDINGLSMQCVAIIGAVIAYLTGRRFTQDKEVSAITTLNDSTKDLDAESEQLEQLK